VDAKPTKGGHQRERNWKVRKFSGQKIGERKTKGKRLHESGRTVAFLKKRGIPTDWTKKGDGKGGNHGFWES